jgi:hypothetical protein
MQVSRSRAINFSEITLRDYGKKLATFEASTQLLVLPGFKWDNAL